MGVLLASFRVRDYFPIYLVKEYKEQNSSIGKGCSCKNACLHQNNR